MRRAEVEKQNAYMRECQRQFCMAADGVTDAWTKFAEVQAVAVIGSVAKALWKEVLRFTNFVVTASKSGTSAAILIWRRGSIHRSGLGHCAARPTAHCVLHVKREPASASSATNSTSF
jgi:hypothetical protein